MEKELSFRNSRLCTKACAVLTSQTLFTVPTWPRAMRAATPDKATDHCTHSRPPGPASPRGPEANSTLRPTRHAQLRQVTSILPALPQPRASPHTLSARLLAFLPLSPANVPYLSSTGHRGAAGLGAGPRGTPETQSQEATQGPALKHIEVAMSTRIPRFSHRNESLWFYVIHAFVRKILGEIK